MIICTSSWSRAVTLAHHKPRCQQLGRLKSRGSCVADQVSETSCWRDPPCTHICSHWWTSVLLTREGSRCRSMVLFLFMWVLWESVCEQCGHLCIYIYRCGVSMCSACTCLLGIHLQLHCWLDLGAWICSNLTSQVVASSRTCSLLKETILLVVTTRHYRRVFCFHAFKISAGEMTFLKSRLHSDFYFITWMYS